MFIAFDPRKRALQRPKTDLFSATYGTRDSLLQVGFQAAELDSVPNDAEGKGILHPAPNRIGLRMACSSRSVQNDKGATVAESPNGFLVLATSPASSGSTYGVADPAATR